ncbi:FtsX-like permease family protein [Marinobacter sp. GN3S48]|uniref:FtsX-like permease family protein n=1 Tax=Marinobacter sp. GN3S48 TaxID=3382302 RepID=UPI00387B5D84
MTLFAALFSHYRRHPMQLVALALMIVLATTLWTGVSHLTDLARASLAQSEQAVAGRQQVVREDQKAVTVSDFVRLRRQGLCVMPWLEVQRPAPEGRVIGVDPFAGACFGDDVPGQAREDLLDGHPFLDISEASELASQGQPARLALLVEGNMPAGTLPTGYRIRDFSMGPDTGELGESFLLNLDALGLLVLLITALLVRSVYLLGLAQRRESFALLERFGVPAASVRWWLLIELTVLTTLCVVPGIWLGRWLASALGSGFGEAMERLFDAPLYAVQTGDLLWPALVMALVVLAACFVDTLKPLWRIAPGSRNYRLLLVALLLAGLATVALTTTLIWLFTGIAVVFVALGLLTPRMLSGLADWQARRSGDVVRQWRLRELSVLFRRLAMPVVALQFAVAMVLAIQALVTTFEDTFETWLGQRLAAELYVEVPEGEPSRAAVAMLSALEDLGDWHLVQRGRVWVEGMEGAGRDSEPVATDLFAISPIGPLVDGWELLSAAPGAWSQLAAGTGVMVNEQLARRQGFQPGDEMFISVGGDSLRLPVVGVYADYGRPAGEVLLAGHRLPGAYSPAFESFSINTGSLPVAQIEQALTRAWDTEKPVIRDNESIRSLASAVFDQTFLLTRAITLLTLALAAGSLLMMGWVFFTTRAWYFRLLSVWGMSRAEVAGQLCRLAMVLTGALALVALPLGIWLTWVLVSRINPLAFGWSLPMTVYPGFWLEMAVLCLAIGGCIALLMRRQLTGQVPPPEFASGARGGER